VPLCCVATPPPTALVGKARGVWGKSKKQKKRTTHHWSVETANLLVLGDGQRQFLNKFKQIELFLLIGSIASK
jgi:hypothetical protein